LTGLLTLIIISPVILTIWTLSNIGSLQSSSWTTTPLNKFSSYEELKTFLNRSHVENFVNYPVMDFWSKAFSFNSLRLSPESFAVTDSPEYSQTNIQVEGVDEADWVKTDGHYIYIVSKNTIFILKAYPPEEAEVLSKISLDKNIEGLFINDKKLIVFLGGPFYDVYRYGDIRTPHWMSETFIEIYDLTNISSPNIVKNVTVNGYYFNSRMIGDYVYAVICKPAYLDNTGEVSLPMIQSNDIKLNIEPSSMYYLNNSDYYHAFTNIVSINVKDPDQDPHCKTLLLGATCNTYVSHNNIYITSPSYTEGEFKNELITNIHKISIQNGEIEYFSNGWVPGRILNQFSMDEHEGYFRIATTTGQSWFEGSEQSNNLFVLNSTLSTVGRLENLAPKERIYSARFMGSKCYLVTFRKVDPLFVIDLNDPKNPKVLGKLKIPGYSDYLHLYDENHLIGIGKETVAAEEGDFSWYQGVKISFFDVTDVSSPKEVDKVEIGDRGTDSPVLRDHKAFLFCRSKNLLVLPILLAEIDEEKYSGSVPPNAHGEFVWQGAYVYDISSEQGLTLRGRITHLKDDEELLKSGFYFESSHAIKRSLYIDNILYTISENIIMMNDLENLEEINTIDLS
jgi:uncharacterized secreted protein with C-terminal beta-propeller domain